MAKEIISSQLQAVVEAIVQNPGTNTPGALLCVRRPDQGPKTVAAGVSEIETATVMARDDGFRAGSVMKPLVAAVVLQLAEEGLFSLDDPMTTVLPTNIASMFANSDGITVRMLLNHTSGIPEWLTDAVGAEIASEPNRVISDREYFKLAADQTPTFPPGEGFTYSNTDYNLLGLVIEQATGQSWRSEIRERLVEQLHLFNTLLPEPGESAIPGRHAHGYMDFGAGLMDMTEIDPSMAGAAGGHALVTTTDDLVRFLDSLLDGKLFRKAETLNEMLTFVGMTQGKPAVGFGVGYGLGLMKFLLPGSIEMIGHAGTTGGYQCFVYKLPNHEISISGMMNNMASDQMQLIGPALEILVPGFSL
jgi:D-alanyl-D-alanine carboxypeptidase